MNLAVSVRQADRQAAGARANVPKKGKGKAALDIETGQFLVEAPWALRPTGLASHQGHPQEGTEVVL